MKKRILIMISVIVLIATVGCSQDTVEVITSTTKQPTTVVTTTTTTTKPITTTTKPSTTNIATTTSCKTTSTTKQQTTQHTTTKPKLTTQKEITTKAKSKPTTTKKITTTKQEATEFKCTKSKHISPVGNIDKWFDSKTDLKSYVDSTMRYWNEQESNGNITYEEYTKKCPYGYEAWTCAGCGMWTGNFKYI